jgi:hypothetical protein
VAFTVDGSGNIYATGTLDKGSIDYDIWLGKAVTGTSWAWSITKTGTANSYDYSSAVAVDGAGNAYVTGSVRNTDTNDDIWLGRTSDGLTWSWDITKSGTANSSDYAIKWKVDNSGNVYIVGYVYMTATGNTANIWFAKYTNGTLQYEILKNSPDALYSFPNNFLIDPDGNVYIYGQLDSFDNSYDLWLGKYGPSGSLIWEINKVGNQYDSAYDILPLQPGWTKGEQIIIVD